MGRGLQSEDAVVVFARCGSVCNKQPLHNCPSPTHRPLLPYTSHSSSSVAGATAQTPWRRRCSPWTAAPQASRRHSWRQTAARWRQQCTSTATRPVLVLRGSPNSCPRTGGELQRREARGERVQRASRDGNRAHTSCLLCVYARTRAGTPCSSVCRSYCRKRRSVVRCGNPPYVVARMRPAGVHAFNACVHSHMDHR